MTRATREPLWYKDAVIYQLHIKAFFDGSGDGTGDLAGLTSKLDYLQQLGVDVLWLLPFYPSPLRDDGYDIADYRGVHPAYGTMREFRHFVRAAHERGLRVVTELVVNHTSDQHPWFERARRSPRGSVYRNFYVWSDSDSAYAGTRIIFTDTESSNWTWDSVAQQYYWHRFFSHQPDLNFDNPRVFRAIADVMRFWFDIGVDGMRLDAVPYLCEREGTNNENLPETHAIIKRLRAIVDREYPDRFLLAEANQWPEDVRAYFGDGDECHMAFHFPLMPRMFMAIASEDRYPIYDIMRQTPPIPESCQWAIFLRNHDEMTLEMVSDRERAFMYSVYAAEARARVNVGIRRRLAPLMENDRSKIELMTSLLFSMPGTPIVYYGDEIGMGDNIYLGDRDGVRTPMQWSIDRNGGFSRADAQRLHLPVVQDPIYGYTAVNVEAQERSSSSLLNWVKRMIAARKAHRVFGRGSLTFLYPENRRVLAYLREHEGETVLCVANLAATPQAALLDLATFAGRVPVEMLGRSAFPPIGADLYMLTLPRHAFFWFVLQPSAIDAPAANITALPPEFFTVVLPTGWPSLLRDPGRSTMERDVLPALLPSRRWYAAKETTVAATHLRDAIPLDASDLPPLLVPVDVHLRDGRDDRYLLAPTIALETSELPAVAVHNAVARCRIRSREGLIYDGSSDDRFWIALAARMREHAAIATESGVLHFEAGPRYDALLGESATEINRVQAEQSNTSAIVNGTVMLKIYRRIQEGVNAEIEMGRYLRSAGFTATPALLGTAVFEGRDGERTALAVAHEYVLNQGDGWNVSLTFLRRFIENLRDRPADVAAHGDPLLVYDRYAQRLGERLAEMHKALAAPSNDPAFAPEPASGEMIVGWGEEIAARAEAQLDALERLLPSLRDAGDARAAVASRERIIAEIRRAAQRAKPAAITRIHGDFHMGQVLVVEDDVLIVDLEGETQLALRDRRRKQPQLRDVAGMLRSFDYAGRSTLLALGDVTLAQEPPHAVITRWKQRAVDGFLNAYESTRGAEIDRALLRLFVFGKAIYELGYELANRPQWVAIPIRGLLELLEREHA